MSQTVTLNEVLNKLSEKSIDNTRQLRRSVNQRRNGMEDLYGVCFSANGDANYPATFYISLSPDYVYLQRFAFKFVIKPYRSTVAGASGSGITIGATRLDGGGGGLPHIIENTSTLDEEDGGAITPNPHTHDVSGGLGGLDYGIKQIETISTDWQVKIDGVDITPYLIEQHDGNWITGEGVFPNNRLDDVEAFYDILDVASVMTAEGDEVSRDKILAPKFKKVELLSNAPFGVDAYLYLKYSNTNR